MMFPARTFSPPNFLMPRNFGFESRPLREEPTPFLCAMEFPRSAEVDVVDADLGKALPMSLLLRVILPALELEDDDLVAKTVLNDRAGDCRALQHRDAGLGRLS